MQTVAQVDIHRLTVEAEMGRGCFIKAALDGVEAIDERIEILSRMAEINSLHRKENPNVPYLIVEGIAHQLSEALIGLVRVSPGTISWRQNIYRQRIALQA